MAAFVWYWGKRRPDPDRGSFQKQMVQHHLILAGLPIGVFVLISEDLGNSDVYALTLPSTMTTWSSCQRVTVKNT